MKRKQLFDLCCLVALVMAGMLLSSCSKDEKNPFVKSFSTEAIRELSDDGGATTRGLEREGSTIKAVWKASDKVYAFPDNSSKSIGTLSPMADKVGSERTKLDGSLNSTGLKVGDYLNFVTPRDVWDYTGQVGTLADIESKYDYAQARVYITEISANGMKGSTANFSTEQAIIRFTIKGADGALMNIPSLTISAAGKKLATGYTLSGGVFTPSYGDLTITPASATSEIYVALRNDTEGSDTYTLLTTVNGNAYNYTRSGVTFKKGTPYHVTVTMSLNDDTYSERSGYGTEEEQVWD